MVTNPVVNENNSSNDGFQKVVNRKHNNKGSSAGNTLPKGVLVSKGLQVGKDFEFKAKAPNVGYNGNNGTRDEPNSKASPFKTNNGGESLSNKDTNVKQQDTGKKKISNIASPNPFATLGVDDDEEEEVENIWDESENLNLCKIRASTLAQTSNLVGHAGLMRNRPWVLLGDFNAALNLEDHSAGDYEPNAAIREFKECVQAMEVADVISTSLYLIWNHKPRGSNGILKNIDRIMGNLQFNDDFPGSFAIFQPYHISDHSPCVLRIPTVTKPKPKPFKFSNFLVYKEGFCKLWKWDGVLI
nr:RNA-directed DNA polymerase, eukaryota, reverse transcriptase zinc-binding domain protein [Tanacetum cinerariifolium]